MLEGGESYYFPGIFTAFLVSLSVSALFPG